MNDHAHPSELLGGRQDINERIYDMSMAIPVIYVHLQEGQPLPSGLAKPFFIFPLNCLLKICNMGINWPSDCLTKKSQRV